MGAQMRRREGHPGCGVWEEAQTGPVCALRTSAIPDPIKNLKETKMLNSHQKMYPQAWAG